MATQNENPGTGNTKKYVLIGIGTLGGLALAGYFVYRHYKSGASSGSSDDLDTMLDTSEDKTYTLPQQSAPKANNSSSAAPSSDSTFPLKQGSRGPLVTDLQNEIMRAFGASSLPKYGADGKWGTEVTKALSTNKLPTTIDLADYTKIKSLPSAGIVNTSSVTSTAVSAMNAGATATGLFTAIKAGSYSATMALLSRMKTPADYKVVGDLFKQLPWDGLRRYSLVTAVFTTFTDPNQKKDFTKVFLNMGLKQDPKTTNWSNPLSGITLNVETIQETTIWDGNGIELEVSAHTLLGEQLSREMDIVRFRTADGWDMYVLADHVIEK